MTQDDMPQGLAPGALLNESEGPIMGAENHDCRLPAGWEKVEQFVGTGAFGEVWLGHRRDTQGLKVRRVLRMLPLDGHDELRDRLVSRLSSLSNLAAPHVSLPSDFWQTEDGCLVIASARHGKPLEALLTPDRGLAGPLEPYKQWARWAASHLSYDVGDTRSERLLGQLLTGLARLHAKGISHGDVRPRNIFLDDEESAEETAWLADAAIGPLARWSEGRMRSPDALHYHPPEWNGTPQDASFQADLFALGLTFCEAVLGSDANPRRREGNNNFSRTDRNRLLAQLAEHGISRRVRRVVAKLLEPAPQARPASAVDVLELWRRQNNPSLRGLLSWGIAAVLLMLLILAWRGWGEESRAVAELSERVQKRDDDIAKLVKERDDYKSQRDQMTGQVNQMTGQLNQMTANAASLSRIEKLLRRKIDGPPEPTGTEPPTDSLSRTEEELLRRKIDDDPPPPPGTEPPTAEDVWLKSIPSVDPLSPLKLCDQQIKAIENVFKNPPPDLSAEDKNHLRNWLNALKSVRITRGAVAWAWYDEKFQDLLQKAVKQPWGEGPGASNVKLAQDRLNVVKDAYKKWLVWAANSEMTWDDLRSEIQAAPADQRDLLAQWRDDVMKRTNVEMQLVSGKSDDWGTTQRNVYVYGSTMKPSGWHQWAANTSHTYPSTGKAPDTVAFQWQPGEPLRIVLEAERSWHRIWTYNPNLIDHTFKGPLALWQANRIGQIQSGNRLLKFEIKNCPGPPFPKRP